MPTLPADADAALCRALIDSCGDVFALADADGTLRYVSPSVERVLGYRADERVARSVFTLIHEDDLAAVRHVWTRACAAPGTGETFVSRVRHKDGSWRHIEATVVNRLDAAVGGIVVNYRDISRRVHTEALLRDSEARFRSLIQSAAYGICRTTAEGRILDANPAFVRMLGCESLAEACALDMRDVYAKPDERAALVREILSDAAVPAARLVQWKRKDGRQIDVWITAQGVEDGSGVMCLQGMAEDVTGRRAAEEQIRQSQKMEAVGRLARGIAHDFNNVLAAIMGNADLLQLRVKSGDPMAADLQEISAAAERGAALTRQLLAFSQARERSEPEVLDLHEVVGQFDSMLRRLSGDIELRLHMPGPSPRVRLAPGHIEQMTMNLVLNAREAAGEGGTIDVQADTIEVDAAGASRFTGLQPGRYARLAVTDNGPGIHPAIQAHLFEPFFSTKDPAKGPGLGLSIVYGLAKDAGGAVSFSSRPGGGTIFEVLLPIA